jgi:hypothetical protein
MHPVSNERVEWLKARIEVLRVMTVELRDRPQKYMRPGVDNSLLSPAMTSIRVELLSLLVELEVLTEFIAKHNLEKLEREQKRLDDTGGRD